MHAYMYLKKGELNSIENKVKHTIFDLTKPKLTFYIPQPAMLQSRLYKVEDCRRNAEVSLHSKITKYEHKMEKHERKKLFCFEIILNHHISIAD